MIEWQAPAALLALLALPLLRWLHRFRAVAAPWPVSALFLWRGAKPAAAAGTHRAHPDPAWWRRALLAALLVVAVAGPRWQRPVAPPLDVWIDDRPSLYSLEGDATRLAAGLAEVTRLAGSRSDVMLRSLTRPGVARPLAAADGWPAHPGPQVSRLPAPLGFADDRERWLLSDGSDPAVNRWARLAAPLRVIRVGTARDNQALVQLALRRGTASLQGQAAVFNGGTRTAQRRLVVSGDGATLLESDISLTPGERISMRFEVTEPWPRRVVARLDGDDPLADDDTLAVDTTRLEALPVAIDPSCPAPLRAALERHPGLVRGALDVAELQVACGITRPNGPGLWWRQGQVRPVAGTPVWLAAAGTLQALALPTLGGAVETPPDAPPGKTLLADDRGALVVVHDGPATLVELRLRPTDGSDARWPLLVDGLLSRVVGRSLLDPLVVASRPPERVHIAPRGDAPRDGQQAARPAWTTQPIDLSTWLLLAALPLVAFELKRPKEPLIKS